MNAARLYTPELLAAAVELANYPPLETSHISGHARSPTCGSTVYLDIVPLNDGTISQLGLRVMACAIGQGAAAIFARHARGRTLAEIERAHDQLVSWLDDEWASPPEWPDFHLISPARNFPARHGAMLLPWKAAVAALSSAPTAS